MASGQGNENNNVMRLKELQWLRRGKKGNITRRIKDLEHLVEKKGKKDMIMFLINGLKTVYDELAEACNEIAVIEEYECDDYNDIEEVRGRVEMCVALVHDHIGGRSDTSSSTGSFTSSWCRRHGFGNYQSIVDQGSELAGDLNLSQDEFDNSNPIFDGRPLPPPVTAAGNRR